MSKDKKRKREGGHASARSRAGSSHGGRDGGAPNVDTSKPSAVFQPTGGRRSTVSVALPGSIIANAQSHDQKTFLAGQIARALAVFCVDEVVIFDDHYDHHDHNERASGGPLRQRPVGDAAYTGYSHPAHFLSHVLSYLETPPYLRKALFPMHPNLRTAGTLPSLDMPHHLRAGEWCEYREGVTTAPMPGGRGTYVDVGLSEPREILDAIIPPQTRVTAHLPDSTDQSASAVAPSTPREQRGYYWGYTVRQCGSLSAVFTESPFDGGYSYSIGTSERGRDLAEVLQGPALDGATPRPDTAAHVLLVFGGVAGIESAAAHDGELRQTGITSHNVQELFDCWVNVLPGQGSRTIRTEEALWLGLMGLRPVMARLAADARPETPRKRHDE